MPIPFFVLQRVVYERLASDQWRGLPTFALNDAPLLRSALAAPFATAGGNALYPTVPAKAGCLFRGLVKNHGLVDGNKRLAATTTSVFLLLNGWVPAYTNNQLYLYALRVARSKGEYPVSNIERWIRRHAKLYPEAELARIRLWCAALLTAAPMDVQLAEDQRPVMKAYSRARLPAV